MLNPAPGRCDGSAKSGWPAMVKGMPKSGPLKWHACHGSGALHACRRLDAAQYLLIVADELLRLRESAFGDWELEGEHVIGLHAEIDVGQIPEAVHGQSGAGEQRQGQREFAHHQQLPQTIAHSAGAGAAALFERLCRIDARCIPCGGAAEKQSCKRGGRKRDQQYGQIQAKFGLTGKRVGRHDRDEAAQHGIAQRRHPRYRR